MLIWLDLVWQKICLFVWSVNESSRKICIAFVTQGSDLKFHGSEHHSVTHKCRFLYFAHHRLLFSSTRLWSGLGPPSIFSHFL